MTVYTVRVIRRVVPDRDYQRQRIVISALQRVIRPIIIIHSRENTMHFIAQSRWYWDIEYQVMRGVLMPLRSRHPERRLFDPDKWLRWQAARPAVVRIKMPIKTN